MGHFNSEGQLGSGSGDIDSGIASHVMKAP